jgi:hypothetical protein
MSYSFRIRVSVPPSSGVNIDEPIWPIGEGPGGQRIVLASQGASIPIWDSRVLIIRGSGFETAEAAEAAAANYRDMLTRAFACLRIAVDFGDRAAKGGFTQSYTDAVSEATGGRLLNDVHGTMVFETEPPPSFISTGPFTVQLPAQPDRLRKALSEAAKAPPPSEQERLAYDLFSASFFEESPDARFLMLMMAVETLIDPAPRSEKARDHVEHLKHLTDVSTELTPEEKESLLGSLKGLLLESISQGGQRLAMSLGDREYMELRPAKFFTVCYKLRSKLVHGRIPRPGRDEVGHAAASLELFVSHLLAGPLRDLEL